MFAELWVTFFRHVRNNGSKFFKPKWHVPVQKRLLYWYIGTFRICYLLFWYGNFFIIYSDVLILVLLIFKCFYITSIEASTS